MGGEEAASVAGGRAEGASQPELTPGLPEVLKASRVTRPWQVKQNRPVQEGHTQRLLPSGSALRGETEWLRRGRRCGRLRQGCPVRGLFAVESVDPAWSPLHLISGLLQELADRKPVISLLLCALTS